MISLPTLKSLLIAYRPAQIGNRFIFASDHIAAVFSAGSYILIDAVIALYQFCETQITRFAV